MSGHPEQPAINNMREIDRRLRAQFILVFGQATGDPEQWPDYACTVQQNAVLMTVKDTPYDEQRLRHVIESIGLEVTGHMAYVRTTFLKRIGITSQDNKGKWCTWQLDRNAY